MMKIPPGLETLDEEEEAAAAVAVDESGDNARLNKSSLLPLVLPHVPDHRRYNNNTFLQGGPERKR